MPYFISFTTSIAELNREKIAYSVTHSPSLFDVPGTEALTLRNSSFSISFTANDNDEVFIRTLVAMTPQTIRRDIKSTM